MHFNEFKTQVEAQGVKLPAGWGGKGGHTYRDFAGLGYPGTGNPIDFTDYDIRLAVSWGRVHDLAGTATGMNNIGSDLTRRATQMLTLYEFGWVVITEKQVYWTDVPTVQVFDKGAVCIPVL